MRYTIWCLLQGDSFGKAFYFTVDKTTKVSQLKKVINESFLPEGKRLDHEFGLTLWHVNLPDEMENIEDFIPSEDSAVEMAPSRDISHYFPQSPREFHIHIIVQLPDMAPTPTQASHKRSQEEDNEEANKRMRAIFEEEFRKHCLAFKEQIAKSKYAIIR